MIYTGIGARKTPDNILTLMDDIAVDLGDRGFTLRSGGADGADTAFEEGCDSVDGKKEIYLPWEGFNNNPSKLFNVTACAYEAAEEIYGARWRNISVPVRQLMARNMQQLAGKELDNYTDFVVCWTSDGCTTKSTRTNNTGGTGQAIAYGDTLSVPIFNLKNDNDFSRLMKYIDTIGAIEW